MMKMRTSLLITLCLLIVVSCSKSFLEDDTIQIEPIENVGPELLSEDNYTQNREVMFKIEGDYSGLIDMTVFLHNSMPIVPIKGINSPWEQTFKIPDTSSLIGGYANAYYSDDNAGEIARLKLFYEDKLLYNVIRESNGEGITLSLDTYHFNDHLNDQTATTDHIGKKISYRISSNSEGPVNVIYQVASGGYENVIVELPFIYSFIVTEASMAANVYYGGGGLKEVGDKITIELFIDDEEVQSSSVTRTGENEYFNGIPIYYPFY